MTSPAIELRDVQKSFGNVKIIHDLNLTVAKGERHAIIGPNGAGKSTTFNLICGYIAPTSGSVLLEGEAISGLPPYQINRRGLSRSFQVTNVFANMTRVGEYPLRRALGDSATRYAFWKNVDNLPEVRERTAQILEDDQPDAARDVPAGLLTYAEQRALEIGITVAGGAARHSARRADRRNEPGRDRARRGTHPPPDRRPNTGDGRARHERGVWPRRPDFGAGVRPNHRHRDPRPDPVDRRSRKPISARRPPDARGRGPARLLRQEPYPAGRGYAYRRRRDREPAGTQRRRAFDDGQGHHGRGAAAWLDQVQG